MIDFFTEIGDFIMAPVYYIVSAALVGWHWLFSQVFDPDDGVTWVLSILGLTLLIRAAMIPLFVKQIKSSRNMQLIQPKVKELQKKYGHDREKLTQETMKLYKDTGTNPFASCLPILLQMPVFFGLFRLINNASQGKGQALLTQDMAHSLDHAEFFGIPIAGTLFKADGDLPLMATAIFLVLAMTATTFFTQRQLMSKNMPADAMSGPYAQQQKMLLYVLPIAFAFGGVAFPIALLIYWTTSNLWTMGQQFWVIRNNPAPGTEAARAKEQRDREKAIRHGEDPDAEAKAAAAEAQAESDSGPRPAQRQQPKRQTREQRKKKGSGPRA